MVVLPHPEDPVAVAVVHLHHRSGGGTQYLHRHIGRRGIADPGAHGLPQLGGGPEHPALLRPGDRQRENVREGRIPPGPADADLPGVKAVVVLGGGAGDDLVVRGEGLDHRPAVLAPPARPAHHLGQQAEGPLGGVVVVHVQAQVRRHHAHQGHVFKIQSLGHHLGAKKDGYLFLFKFVQQRLVVAGHRVRVHTQDVRAGEQGVQLLLHLLGARADLLDDAAALRAAVRGAFRVAAVVAHQPPVGAVISQGHAAPGALGRFAALAAQQHPAGTAAVEEQDALLPTPQVLLQLPAQGCADHAAVSGADLLPHVGDDHPGQGLPVEPGAEDHFLIHPPLGLIGGLHRRRGGAQHQHRVLLGTQELGHVPGVIPGRVLGLVAALVLLVQNDHPQVLQRGEDRAPGPQDDVHLSPADALPLVVALRHPQAAVEHHHPAPEVGGKFCHHLGGQGDLRHQDHAPPAPADHLLEEPDVYQRLAAAGDAVEQGAGGALPVQPLHDAVIGRLLLLAEDDGRAVRRLRLGHPQDLRRSEGDEAALFQAFQCPGGGAGEIADIRGQRAPHGTQQFYHLIPHGGAALFQLHGGHGLLGADCQRHLAGPLVGDLPVGGGLNGQEPPPLQLPGHAGGPAAAGQTQGLQLRAAAVGAQGLQDPALPVVGPGDQGCLPVHGQGAYLPQPVPEPGGQQHLHRRIQGAEIPFPKPEGQLDLLGAQDALIVQDLGDGLQSLPLAVLPHGEDEALAGPVPFAEGDGDPHPGPDLSGQLLRDQVVVWLVDGIGGGADGYPRYAGQLHGLSPCPSCTQKAAAPLFCGIILHP